uniref:Uncharacterized protein n=1 Tax=viral metagenome TaxID=1070528 RepID=A0A6M3IEN0_9ZZZZ
MTSGQKRVLSTLISKAQSDLEQSREFLLDGSDSNTFHFLMEASRHIKDAITRAIEYERLYKLKGVKRYGHKGTNRDLKKEA